MVGKRFLSTLIGLGLIFSLQLSNVNADTKSPFNIKERKAAQTSLKSRKNSLERTLKETQDKVKSKRQQYDTVNKQIMAAQEQRSKLTAKIKNLNSEITYKARNIDVKQKEVQENTEVLMRRLVAVYKAGEVHAIDLILNAKTFEDLVDKAEIINKVSEHDNKLLEALKSDIQELEEEKKSLELKKSTLESEQAKLDATETELHALLDENERLVKELEGEQAAVQVEIDESDAEYQRIQQEIDRYVAEEAERQRKAEEARKKAEEARKKAETEALAKKQANTKTTETEKLSSTKTATTTTDASTEKDTSNNKYTWPVPSCRTLSSQYLEKRGKVYHKGIDIAGPGIYGKDVVAAAGGTVIAAFDGCKHDYGKLRSCGCGGGYGNYVIISHGNGRISIYGHLAKVHTYSGKSVKKGEKIGEVGTTGYSTGAHLHYQTKQNGIDYNPMDDFKNK